MSITRTALFVGLLLGIVLVFGNFGEMLLVALFGAIGFFAGRAIEGKVDFAALFGRTEQ